MMTVMGQIKGLADQAAQSDRRYFLVRDRTFDFFEIPWFTGEKCFEIKTQKIGCKRIRKITICGKVGYWI